MEVPPIHVGTSIALFTFRGNPTRKQKTDTLQEVQYRWGTDFCLDGISVKAGFSPLDSVI